MKNLIKNSLNILKKKWFILISLDLVCASICLAALYFGIKKIKGYMLDLQILSSEISDLASTIAGNTSSYIGNAEFLLVEIGKINNRIIFTAIIIISITFLTYYTTQTRQWLLIYKYLKKEVHNLKKFYLHFLWLSLAAFIMLIPLAYKILVMLREIIVSNIASAYNLTNQSKDLELSFYLFFIVLLFLIILLKHLLHVFYASLYDKNPFKRFYQNLLNKNNYKILGITILAFLIALVFIITLSSIYSLAIGLILILLIIQWYRISLGIETNYSKSH